MCHSERLSPYSMTFTIRGSFLGPNNWIYCNQIVTLNVVAVTDTDCISYLGQLRLGLVDVRPPLLHQANVPLPVDGCAAERARIGNLWTLRTIYKKFQKIVGKVLKISQKLA